MDAERLDGRFNTALALGLASGRLALGTVIWVAPGPALRALGFDPDAPQARTLSRLTATRDLATGALALAALGDAGASRRAALLNAVIDAGDAAALAIAFRERGTGTAHGAAVGAPAALLASAGGALLAARLARKS